jgi:TolB protein
LEGFDEEIHQILKFDLEIQGFQVLPEKNAAFLMRGGSEGGIKGEVLELAGRTVVLPGRHYTGGTPRKQAHRLADDAIKAVTGRDGISQTRIAFKVDFGKYNEIVIADYDGHNAFVITRDEALAFGPAWTPDGRQLFYTSYKLGNPDIFMQDLASSKRTIIARYSGLNTSPAVSPDGQRLAMILSKAGSPDLYVGRIDGSELDRLTTTKAEEASPCWSPDGSRICFVSTKDGRAGLYTIRPTGGAMERVRTVGVFNCYEPDWSPDGKQIAFTTQQAGGFTLCLVPAEGGTVQKLTAGEDPSWAPNSRTLLFTRRTKSKRVLSLLDAPTEQVKDIAQFSGSSSQPSWAR